jgi:uncharacterized protein (TIGR02145 family)
LRKRQSPLDPIVERVDQSPRQKTSAVNLANSTVPGLQNIPANYFEPNTIGAGLNGTGLLKSRPNIVQNYTGGTTFKGNPLLVNPQRFFYFFIEYNNSNEKGIGSLLKSFSIIKMLNDTDLKTFSELLGSAPKSITPISEETYNTGSFSHPKYINDNGTPLVIKYKEIQLVNQVTPGRLDDAYIGYPDFGRTPDTVIGTFSPLPGAPYTTFTALGATATITVSAGGTVAFKDLTPKTPWQTAPTGWNWSFGSFASPTGSTAENPIITYGATTSIIWDESQNVTLTTSNNYGSTSLTKSNFVIITSNNSVTIGTQKWSLYNLDVTTYRNGDTIPQVTDTAAWAGLTSGAWCYYNNDSSNGNTYGKLYNWFAVNDSRGLAPEGWHIPTDSEWTTLITYLGGTSVAGGAIKTTTGWNSPNTGATNSSGFTGLPGGYRLFDGSFLSIQSAGIWWASNQSSSTNSYFVQASSSNASLLSSNYDKNGGLSIRLIKD